MSVFVSFISASCTSSGGQQTVNIRSGGNGADETLVAYSLSGPAGSYSGGDYYSESGTTGPINHTFDLVDLPDGDFTLTASNNLGQEKTVTFTVACGTSGGGGGGGTPPPPPPPPPSTVYGCTDPEADNYDPAATDDNGSCIYTPRLVAAALPELAPLGVPLWASVSAAVIASSIAKPATVLVDLTLLASRTGVAVLVDGYRFISGPLIAPQRFTSAASLLAAMQALPALAVAYVFTQPSPAQILITARVPGLPGTPTVSTSQPGVVTLTATAGVAALYSQKRYQWGCYVEVWASCGNLFGGPVDKSLAVLAQRIVLPYRTDNTYQVDVAPALRGFTGHAYPAPGGLCPDRLISYYLRFGEEYSDTPTGLRRVRTTYETPVAWGLEAMVVPAPVAGVYLLSSRPSPWRVVAGRRAVAALLTKQADPLALVLRYRLATSRATQDATLSVAAQPQQVRSYVPYWLLPAGTLATELRPADDNGTVGEVLARAEVQAQGVGLTFVNREGGADTFFFAGSNEENDKRTAAAFTNTAGLMNLSAELQASTKLYSGLLDFATWDWLRQQLGVSPAVWLETQDGPVRVAVGELVTDSDSQKGEHSLAVTLNPPLVRGLSN